MSFLFFPKIPPFSPVFSFMSNFYKSAVLFICFIYFPYKYKKSGPVPFPGHPCFFRLIFIPFSPFRRRMPPGQLFCIGKAPVGFPHKYPYVFRIIQSAFLRNPFLFGIISPLPVNPIRKSYWIHSGISTMMYPERRKRGNQALLPQYIRVRTNSYLLSMRQEVLS